MKKIIILGAILLCGYFGKAQGYVGERVTDIFTNLKDNDGYIRGFYGNNGSAYLFVELTSYGGTFYYNSNYKCYSSFMEPKNPEFTRAMIEKLDNAYYSPKKFVWESEEVYIEYKYNEEKKKYCFYFTKL